MKRIILTLLACGMFAGTFAQIDISKKDNAGVSDKWVITPVPTMKGVLGRLNINYPAGVDRWILYYQPADNKYMGSVGSNEKTFTISPGEYRFLITDVSVENVPIQKGHETRIKMGFLNVVSEGGFYLYNDTKEKLYTTYDKPKKIALPVGNYQVKLGGQFYPVVVKDGETVEDYTEVEIKGENPIKQNSEIIETDKWLMSPTNEDEGRIVTGFPISGMTLDIYYFLSIRRPGESVSVFYCRGNYLNHCPETYSLAEGLYDVGFGVGGEGAAITNNPIIVSNVPVKKGYETRLKVGYLSHKFRGIYKLFDESMQINYLSYNLQLSPPPIPLPVGNYTVNMPNVGNFNIQIKDGIKMLQSPIDSIPERPRWTITPLPKTGLLPVSIKSGRIISQFPGSDTLKFLLRIPWPNGTGYTKVTLDTQQYFDTKPGIYTAELNNALVEFPVELTKQTQIRFGFITLGGGYWRLACLGLGGLFNFGIHAGFHKRALPIGLYVYKYSDNKYYLLKINEGETLVPVLTY